MSLVRNSTNTVPSQLPTNTSNLSAPPGETAEIMLTDARCPVTATTGVCPTGARWCPRDDRCAPPTRRRSTPQHLPGEPAPGSPGTAPLSTAAPPPGPADRRGTAAAAATTRAGAATAPRPVGSSRHRTVDE